MKTHTIQVNAKQPTPVPQKWLRRSARRWLSQRLPPSARLVDLSVIVDEWRLSIKDTHIRLTAEIRERSPPSDSPSDDKDDNSGSGGKGNGSKGNGGNVSKPTPPDTPDLTNSKNQQPPTEASAKNGGADSPTDSISGNGGSENDAFEPFDVESLLDDLDAVADILVEWHTITHNATPDENTGAPTDPDAGRGPPDHARRGGNVPVKLRQGRVPR